MACRVAADVGLGQFRAHVMGDLPRPVAQHTIIIEKNGAVESREEFFAAAAVED